MKTYRDLLKKLQRVPDNRLDDNIAIHLVNEDEYFGVAYINEVTEAEQDVLDDGHLVLAVTTSDSL